MKFRPDPIRHNGRLYRFFSPGAGYYIFINKDRGIVVDNFRQVIKEGSLREVRRLCQ